VLARYDADLSGLMELDEFVRLAHSLGYTGAGAPALPPAVGAVGAGGGWGDEGTRRAGELVVLLGGVSDLPAGAGAAYAVLHVGSRRVHSAPLPPQVRVRVRVRVGVRVRANPNPDPQLSRIPSPSPNPNRCRRSRARRATAGSASRSRSTPTRRFAASLAPR